MTDRENIRSECHLLFILARCMDIIIHDMDYQLRKDGAKFNKDRARDYNLYCDYINKAVTQFNKCFEPTLQGLGSLDGFRDYEILRGQANEIIRLLLAYQENCLHNATLAEQVFNLTNSNPDKVGYVTEEDINRFSLYKRWK